MTFVFLLEEKSMQAFLDTILPKILPSGANVYTIAHEGKSDLQKSIPHKLKAWNTPDTKFFIIQDQDSSDCRKLKQNLCSLCDGYGKEYIVRIACHELEAWYFGDLHAVEQAYGVCLDKYKTKSTYRDPDAIENPKYELRKLVPQHQQISGARKIGAYIDIENNKSVSFQQLINGIKKCMEC